MNVMDGISEKRSKEISQQPKSLADPFSTFTNRMESSFN